MFFTTYLRPFVVSHVDFLRVQVEQTPPVLCAGVAEVSVPHDDHLAVADLTQGVQAQVSYLGVDDSETHHPPVHKRQLVSGLLVFHGHDGATKIMKCYRLLN